MSWGELLGDLGKAATLEDDPHEHAVDLLGALQDGRLPVDDVGERLAEDVVEADVPRDVDDGKVELVGTPQHLPRQRLEVASKLHAQCGQAAGVERRHQRRELGGRGRQRVAGRQQELVLLHPREDVGHGHHVEALHDPVQARNARHDLRGRQRRQPQQLADGRPPRQRPRSRLRAFVAVECCGWWS
jgi:hypothetical protein